MKTRIFVRLLPLLVLLFTLGSCGSDSGNAPTTTAGSQFRAGAGVAQKGPLQLGSLVTTQELDAGLSPTGRQFTYQITSDLGNFSPTAIYSSPFVSIFAFGYYFDEVTNALSGGVIFLNSIADLRVDTGLMSIFSPRLPISASENLSPPGG